MKIALKVDEETLYKALSDAKKNKLPHGKIQDAGHTQVEPGTVTVGFIGPCEASKIDKITGHLKLL